jgi:hypothetical protein
VAAFWNMSHEVSCVGIIGCFASLLVEREGRTM